MTEVYRALALEKDYSKDEILEMYLNTIYLGNQCYGVQTASRMYFHKDVSELDLAEAACLISITNNPSQYELYSQRDNREQNRETGSWTYWTPCWPTFLQARSYACLLESTIIVLCDKQCLIVYEKKQSFDRDSYKKYYWEELDNPDVFNELKNRLNI